MVAVGDLGSDRLADVAAEASVCDAIDVAPSNPQFTASPFPVGKVALPRSLRLSATASRLNPMSV